MSLLDKLYEAQDSKDHVAYEKLESELQFAMWIRKSIEWLMDVLEYENIECNKVHLEFVLQYIYGKVKWGLMLERYMLYRELSYVQDNDRKQCIRLQIAWLTKHLESQV